MASSRMAIRPNSLVLAVSLAVALPLAVAGCKSLNEHDILGALAASPPPVDVEEGGGGGDDAGGGASDQCTPECGDDEACVGGRCVTLGQCAEPCPESDCEVCDGATNECVSRCNPDLCEECDGEGRCESWCGGDQFCNYSGCVDSTGGKCENAADAALLHRADPEPFDPYQQAYDCKFGGCSDNESCIGECMSETSGLSENCARCYARLLLCYYEWCDSWCDESTCDTCLADNCGAEYCQCVGSAVEPACAGATL